MLSRIVELPFGGTAEVISMTGTEEELLFDRNKMADGRALNHLILNCTPMLRGAKPAYEQIANLLSPDRRALLLGIRLETYGAEINGTVPCPNDACRKKFPVYDLSIENVNVVPVEGCVTLEGTYDITLSDDSVAHMRVLDGQREQTIARVSESEMMTTALLVQLNGITFADGSELMENDKKKWLKKVPARFRSELRDGIQEHFVGPDTRFTAICPTCGTEVQGVLEGLQGFFLPQKSSLMEPR